MNTKTQDIAVGTKVILSGDTGDYYYNWATVEKVTKAQVTVNGMKFHRGTVRPGSPVALENKGDFWVTFPWEDRFAAEATKADHAEVAGIAAIS